MIAFIMLNIGVMPTPPEINTTGPSSDKSRKKGPPGFDLRPIRRATDPLDRDTVVILMERAVGKGIATDDRLAFPGDIQLEGDILAGFEHGQRPTVVRRQVK